MKIRIVSFSQISSFLNDVSSVLWTYRHFIDSRGNKISFAPFGLNQYRDMQ